MTGKITQLGNGFGHLTTSVGDELFFHVSALQETLFSQLKIGDTVEYNLEGNTQNPSIKTLKKL